MTERSENQLFKRIRNILESARAGIARSVNTAQVVTNWMIGREIVEQEQRGKKRADYGDRLLRGLSERLSSEYGSGYSHQNLKYVRQFYLEYPDLPGSRQIGHAVRGQFDLALSNDVSIGHAVRGQFNSDRKHWRPGRLHTNLSWTHYRTLRREFRLLGEPRKCVTK